MNKLFTLAFASSVLAAASGGGFTLYKHLFPEVSSTHYSNTYLIKKHDDKAKPRVEIMPTDATAPAPAVSASFSCQLNDNDETKNDCLLFNIPTPGNNQVVEISSEELKSATKKSENLIKSFTSDQISDKYYLLTTNKTFEISKQDHPKLTVQSSGSNSVDFDVVGSFSSDWKYTGKVHGAIAKYKESKAESVSEMSYDTCYVKNSAQTLGMSFCSISEGQDSIDIKNIDPLSFSQMSDLDGLTANKKHVFELVQPPHISSSDLNNLQISVIDISYQDTTIQNPPVATPQTPKVVYFDIESFLIGETNPVISINTTSASE